MSADLYVVFDGPPGPQPGAFVEVENAYGESVNSDPAQWHNRGDGYWTLGPFKAVEATENITYSKTIVIRGNVVRLDRDLVNDAIADIVRGTPRLRKQFFGLKDYDRFWSQRCDSEYGTGPRHGHVVVAIELKPEFRTRDLTVDERADALGFLTRFPKATP